MPKGVYERTKEMRKHMSEAQKKYYETHSSPLKGSKIDRTIVDKQIASRLEYYKDNEAWNKDIKHTKTTRKRISEGMYRYWKAKKKVQ